MTFLLLVEDLKEKRESSRTQESAMLVCRKGRRDATHRLQKDPSLPDRLSLRLHISSRRRSSRIVVRIERDISIPLHQLLQLLNLDGRNESLDLLSRELDLRLVRLRSMTISVSNLPDSFDGSRENPEVLGEILSRVNLLSVVEKERSISRLPRFELESLLEVQCERNDCFDGSEDGVGLVDSLILSGSSTSREAAK